MGRVLLVEDSVECRILVQNALEGYAELVVAADLKGAEQLVSQQKFDLLIVDVDLPDGDGFGFCARLLAEKGAARPRLLFLSGKGALADKLTGFSVGADDYLVKPLDALELRARVQAHLRHAQDSAALAQTLCAGNLRLELGTHRVFVGEGPGAQELELTRAEFKLLTHLLRKEGQVFTREQLKNIGSGKTHVTDRTVDAHLCRLRKKLSSCTHTVEPVYGLGYRLVPREAPREVRDSVPAIDKKYLQELEGLNARGGADLICQLASYFLEAGPAEVRSILAALEASDGERLRREAHAWKSTCLNMGASRMAEVCRELEEGAEGFSLEAARALRERLEREHESVRRELREIVRARGGGTALK